MGYSNVGWSSNGATHFPYLQEGSLPHHTAYLNVRRPTLDWSAILPCRTAYHNLLRPTLSSSSFILPCVLHWIGHTGSLLNQPNPTTTFFGQHWVFQPTTPTTIFFVLHWSFVKPAYLIVHHRTSGILPHYTPFFVLH